MGTNILARVAGTIIAVVLVGSLWYFVEREHELSTSTSDYIEGTVQEIGCRDPYRTRYGLQYSPCIVTVTGQQVVLSYDATSRLDLGQRVMMIFNGRGEVTKVIIK